MPVLAESRRMAWRTKLNKRPENASSNDFATENKRVNCCNGEAGL